ncbi:lipoprotein NlpI [Methyloligella halotolerans]|uniref:Lipoprotein NlpI n=2 Tax=Methyloligella halotolerans TaxID=1177755 RepID=A0A1E2S398_9HYPH|nr:lipoprotein NlpI [Methyloligella halotolerans]
MLRLVSHTPRSGACFVVCLTACLAAATLALPAAARAKEDVTLLRAREGAAALMRGQYDKAIASLNLALEQPEISDFVKASIFSDRGIAKWRLGDSKAAIEDFNESITLSPENASVYNNRGNALLQLGHAEEAVKDFDRAVALSPNYGVAFNNRGNAHVALNEYDSAFQDFRKAVQLMSTSAVPLNGRGQSHAALKRYHAAIRDLTKAVEVDASCRACYANRGKAYLAIESYDKAASDFTQALLGSPDDQELLLLRAKAYLGARQYGPARKDLDKLIALDPEGLEPYLERGKLFTAIGRYDDAIKDLTYVIEKKPSGEAYALRAETKLKDKQPDEALTDALQAASMDTESAFASRVRGDVYRALERNDDAIRAYRTALKKDPFQDAAREALLALDEEVPPAEGAPLGPPVSGWIVKEPEPSRFVALNPKYPAIRAQLEMFGSGKPKILEWSELDDAKNGIGLLRYHAGELTGESSSELVYVAIVDLWGKKVLAVEPYSWGSNSADWEWSRYAVAVTDPEGNTNRIQLRKPKPPPQPTTSTYQPNRPQQRRGGGGGLFDFLFR